MGKVIFVGAGLSSQEYITVKGKQALAEADCILYDQLLDPDVLKEVVGECIYVGKKAGCHSKTQEEINALLIEKAQKHSIVVRLKGGDSFVFGRGGEEAMALKRAGIAFSFVPGITSAVAAAEMAGIPLTHRGIARGFLVLSAHLAQDACGISVAQVQDESITLVILMGLGRLQQIMELLLTAKRKADTPVALITHAGSNRQKVVCGTIATICEKQKQAQLESPCIILVGEVVRLRKELAFWEQRPLFQKRILVCKLHKEKSVLSTLCEEQGAIVEELQVGEIVPIATTFDPMLWEQSKWILFTSQHGVAFFFEQLFQQGYDARLFAGKRIAAIGQKTKQKLLSYGLVCDLEGQGKHGCIEEYLAQYPNETILHICGQDVISFDHPNWRTYPVYQNKKVSLPQISTAGYDAICFSCASSVERFLEDVSSIPCISIGKTTTQALLKKGASKIIEAKETSYEAMVQAMIEEESHVSR